MQEMSGSVLWSEARQGSRQTTCFSGWRAARGRVWHALVGYPHDTRNCNLVGVWIANQLDCNRDAGDADHRINFQLDPKACHATLQERLS